MFKEVERKQAIDLLDNQVQGNQKELAEQGGMGNEGQESDR